MLPSREEVQIFGDTIGGDDQDQRGRIEREIVEGETTERVERAIEMTSV